MAYKCEEIKEYHENGNRKKVVLHWSDYYEIRFYALDGKTLYNGNNPCLITYNETNILDTLSWHNKDFEDDRPTEINFHQNGNVAFLKWFKMFENGPRYDRENGPARIYYNEDGSLKAYAYMKCGKHHRIYGPANCHFFDNKAEYKWLYNGISYDKTVSQWIKENNFKSWEEMKEDDFNRMWFEIL